MHIENDAIERVRVRVLPDGRISRNDAAIYLGHRSSKTLANWATQGRGPRAIKVGGRDYYRFDEIAALARGDAA